MRLWLALIFLALPAQAADFRLLVGHGGPVMSTAISEDGQYALTASFDNSVGLWALDGEEVTWLDGHAAAVKTAIFLGDGRAASGGDDFAIELWDLATGTHRRLEGHQGQINGLAYHGDLLASASWDGSVGLWSLTDGSQIASFTGHGGIVTDCLLYTSPSPRDS